MTSIERAGSERWLENTSHETRRDFLGTVRVNNQQMASEICAVVLNSQFICHRDRPMSDELGMSTSVHPAIAGLVGDRDSVGRNPGNRDVRRLRHNAGCNAHRNNRNPAPMIGMRRIGWTEFVRWHQPSRDFSWAPIRSLLPGHWRSRRRLDHHYSPIEHGCAGS